MLFNSPMSAPSTSARVHCIRPSPYLHQNQNIWRAIRSHTLQSALTIVVIAYQAAGQSVVVSSQLTDNAPGAAGDEQACLEKTLELSEIQGLKVY